MRVQRNTIIHLNMQMVNFHQQKNTQNIVDGVAYISAPYRTDLWCEEIVYVDDVEICDTDAEDGVYYASNLPIIQDGTTKIFVAQYDEENGEAFAYAVFSLTVENGKFATVDEAYIVDSIDEI